MDRQRLEELKSRIPLLDYLVGHDWKPMRQSPRGEIGGLCPLHAETRPSFWIHTRKNLFYCHGCGRGGDLIRFVECFHAVNFPQALAHLRRWMGAATLLAETAAFYRLELHRSPEAVAYLAQRGLTDPVVIERMGIGYARGGRLRQHLMDLGYSFAQIQQLGLINSRGWDTYYRRVVFPCGGNLYGRSIGGGAPHRFLARPKGGLYAWAQVQHAPAVIVVEGIFDVAALWQAGFADATCAWGVHLNAVQRAQLATGRRTVWVAFDGDAPGAQAAQALTDDLRKDGQQAARVRLPPGQDVASYFASGATSADFQKLLVEA